MADAPARKQFNVYLPPALIRRAKYRALDEQSSLSDSWSARSNAISPKEEASMDPTTDPVRFERDLVG